jgi:hypothetical protein
MALVIGDNLYTTTALHTKREKAKVVSQGPRQSHAHNTGITRNKRKGVSKATSQTE